jgi:uncharacterized protein (DUF697 family)/GTP-binding protein EngB required for normal cell division
MSGIAEAQQNARGEPVVLDRTVGKLGICTIVRQRDMQCTHCLGKQRDRLGVMTEVGAGNSASKKVCGVMMVTTARNICPHWRNFALLFTPVPGYFRPLRECRHSARSVTTALDSVLARTLGPMAGSTDWFRDSFRTEYEKQNAALGRFNLAIFGKTGVGKSTLINAIFGEEVARTGIGEPVTRGSHLYLDKVGHLGIVDTQGLEVGKDNKQILSELDKAMTQMRQLPLSEQIHVAWYCIRGMDRRFEEAEADFVRRLDGMGLPVILVLTQVPMRGGYVHPDAVLLAEQIMAKRLPIVAERPFMTYAKADEFAGQPAYGLKELLDATFRVAPEGVQGALVAAQEIDQVRKSQEANKYIAGAAASAAAAAATPIPFSDAALLVPIQLGMMARIAQIYKIKFERAALMAIATTTAATQIGRATFTGLLKMIPGAGTVIGGAIGAGVASTFTYAMGQAWLTVCQRAVKGKLGTAGTMVDNDELREVFMEEFRKRIKLGPKQLRAASETDPNLIDSRKHG